MTKLVTISENHPNVSHFCIEKAKATQVEKDF
jgi:hypothetical protein